MATTLVSLYFLFISSERSDVWSDFYADIGELYMNVAEKPLSATIQLLLFSMGLIVLGRNLSQRLKRFTPLV